MQEDESALLILDFPEEDDPFAGIALPEPPPRTWPPPPAEEVIAAMVGIIVERFAPLQIILFGSRARGTHRLSSDVDLLVVFPVLEDRRALRVAIATSLYTMPLPKDITVATPEELAIEREFVGSLLETAVREGKVLYDSRDQDPQGVGLAALRACRPEGGRANAAGDRADIQPYHVCFWSQ